MVFEMCHKIILPKYELLAALLKGAEQFFEILKTALITIWLNKVILN